MNVRMMPPQGPMGQPQPMGGAPAPMPPQGGPMPVPPMQGQPTAGQQKGQGLGSTFGGSASGRQGFKQFMAAKKQTSALTPQMPVAQMPSPSPVQAPQPMLPAPNPQMMGAMRPMGNAQVSMPVQAGRPMRGSQGGLGSAPVQLNMGGVVEMAPTDGQMGLFVDGQRQDSVPGVYQKMLRAGLPRDEAFGEIESLRDSAMHVADDLGKFLDTPHAGFEHSHDDFKVAGFAEGGEVDIPRETEIMGVPHYLAYIQPEEGDILEDLGGLGEPIGPGGIPTYILHKGWSESAFNPSNWGGGSSSNNSSSSSSSSSSSNNSNIGSSGYVSVDAIANTAVKEDPKTSFSYMGETYDNVNDYHDAIFGDDDDSPSTSVVTTPTNTTVTTTPTYTDTSTISGISAASDVDYTGGTDYSFLDADEEEDYNLGTGTTYDTVYDPFPADDDTDYSILDPDPEEDDNLGTNTDYSEPYTPPPADDPPAYTPPPPKYYDMFGGEHSSQAAADAADAQYEAQAVAAEAVETVTSTPSDTTYSYTGAGAGADTDAGGDTDPASMYESSVFREASVPIPESYMPTSEDIMPGITGTGTGTPASERTEAEENAIRALYGMEPIGADEEEDDLETAVEDIYNIGLEGEFGGLDLDVPEAEVGLEAALPDYSDDDLGLPDFPVEFPDDGESAEDFRRTEAGLSGIDFDTGQREGGEADEDETKDALMDSVKARVSEVEGTSDEGGYDRLLNYQEDNFGITPTEMTVAEILAFQKERGEGSYAEYSRDTVGRIATPVGKYQVVGDTLQRLVDAGVVSADEMFDEATQERIGSYLIENRGLFDENISDEEFVENLGNEFEGIERFGYDDNEVDIFNQPLTGGEDDQQKDTTASQDYLSAMNKLGKEDYDPNNLTEAEQRALYGARGQVPNAAETAYLQKLLSNAKHTEDVLNPVTGEVIAKAGDYVTEQSLGNMFEDLLISGLDMFVNPLSILGGKFTLEGQQDAYIQEQLDAYRDGGTFVYGEDGKTVVGVAKPNYDADNDGVNDTVVLNNENGDFVEDGDDIIITGDGININDVEINDNVDGEDEDDDIDIVFSDTTFENTEDGVVETSVGGTDTTTTGGDNPCPDGYSLVDGMCQPDDGIGTEEGDEAAARVNLRLRKIDRGGGDIPDVTIPDPVEGEALIVRKPAQFFEGGGVYGPDDEDDDYDRYYVRDNVVYTDYGPGVSTYQIGEGEDPSAIINFLDQQGFRETAPADSMDDGSAFLGGIGGNQTTQGQQGQTSLPVYNPDMPDPTDPTIPDYETPVDPDPIADPIHDPRKMIIRAPKQFKTAYDGIVFNPDSGPRNLDPYTGQRINKPAQFAQGGMVTPNIDRFLQSLGS